MDTSPQSNPFAAVGKSFTFTTVDVDTIKPQLQMTVPFMSTATTPTGVKTTEIIKLYFSEAVQGTAPTNAILMDTATAPSPAPPAAVVSTTISGSAVKMSAAWAASTKYLLNMAYSTFTDLAGNNVDSTLSTEPPVLAMTGYGFTTAATPAGATSTMESPSAATATANSAFEIWFNEVVQL